MRYIEAVKIGTLMLATVLWAGSAFAQSGGGSQGASGQSGSQASGQSGGAGNGGGSHGTNSQNAQSGNSGGNSGSGSGQAAGMGSGQSGSGQGAGNGGNAGIGAGLNGGVGGSNAGIGSGASAGAGQGSAAGQNSGQGAGMGAGASAGAGQAGESGQNGGAGAQAQSGANGGAGNGGSLHAQVPQYWIADAAIFIGNAINTADVMTREQGLNVQDSRIFANQAQFLRNASARATNDVKGLLSNARQTQPAAVPALRDTLAQLVAAEAQASEFSRAASSGDLGPTYTVTLNSALGHLRTADQQLTKVGSDYRAPNFTNGGAHSTGTMTTTHP